MNNGLTAFQDVAAECLIRFSEKYAERSFSVSQEIFFLNPKRKIQDVSLYELFGTRDNLPPKIYSVVNKKYFKPGIIVSNDKKDLSTALKISTLNTLGYIPYSFDIDSDGLTESYLAVESRVKYRLDEISADEKDKIRDFLNKNLETSVAFDSAEFHNSSQFFQSIVDRLAKGYSFGILSNLEMGDK